MFPFLLFCLFFSVAAGPTQTPPSRSKLFCNKYLGSHFNPSDDIYPIHFILPTTSGSRLAKFNSSIPFSAFFEYPKRLAHVLGETIFSPPLIDEEMMRLKKFYFAELARTRGIPNDRILIYGKIEDDIPSSKKTWLGIYAPKGDRLIGTLRIIRTNISESKDLSISRVLKDKKIDFDVASLLKDFPQLANSKTILEAGRAFREDSPMGEDGKKIWEIFLGTQGFAYEPQLMVVHVEASGAILYERQYGFKIKKKIFQDEHGKWQLVDQDTVLREDKLHEHVEYIMANDTTSIREKILDRALTDKSYWDFFDRYPEFWEFFENQFSDGQSLAKWKKNPKYKGYFEHFPTGLGR